MAEIKADVREMQARGNYGDGELNHIVEFENHCADATGFWSDGQRLKDSVSMGGEGLRERRLSLKIEYILIGRPFGLS